MPPTLEHESPPASHLLQALSAIRRRVRLLNVGVGVGLVVAAAIGLLLVEMGIDYLLNLPPWPRLVLIILALAGIGYVLVRRLLRPAMAPLSISTVAGHLERIFPQFNDRLRSTVDFINDDIPGSRAMQRHVIDEADQIARNIRLDQVIETRPLRHALSAAGGAIALVVVLGMFVSPQYKKIALSRLLRPFSGLAWPRQVQIDLLGTVPRIVPVGRRIDVKMKLGRGSVDRATLFYQYGDGPTQKQLMNLDESTGIFSASLDARPAADQPRGMLKIWMRAGDDEKTLPAITIVPRLAISRLEAVITPPSYADLPPVTVQLGNVPAVTTNGANVSLKAAFNKPLQTADAGNASPLSLEPAAPNVKVPAIKWSVNGAIATGQWIADHTIDFHLRAVDSDGFKNNGMEEFQILVRPDTLPLVQIESPRRNEQRTANGFVPIEATAEDDYGIKTASLVVQRLGDKKHWTLPLVADGLAAGGAQWRPARSGPDHRRFHLNYQWEMSALKGADLKTGDVLEYHIQVRDNYALNGQYHEPVQSGKLRVTIISQPQADEIALRAMQVLGNQIQTIRNNHVDTQKETADVAKETKDKKNFDPADSSAVERLAGQEATAGSQAKQLAGKLRDLEAAMDQNRQASEQAKEMRKVADEVGKILNETADHPLKNAINGLNRAREVKSAPDQRDKAMTGVQSDQEQATENFDEALKRMGTMGRLTNMINRVQQLIEQQERTIKQTEAFGKTHLGQDPAKMSAADEKELHKIAADQSKIAEDARKAIADLQKAADQMKKAEPADAAAMGQAAEAGQQHNISGNAQKAAQQASQNQQASAQQSQQLVEIGLQEMLSKLREAERRKLAALSAKLARLQEQIARLVREQANHNLDNLTLQGPDAVSKKLDQTALDDLILKAGRSKNETPGQPELPVLDAAQRQTERNTRSVADDARQATENADASGLLLTAARRMETAIISLDDKKLAQAYEPPQVEALKALEEARRIVDEQKRKADEALDKQKKEAIREVYVKIKADQEKLNAETIQIDKAPHHPDGTLQMRRDAMRLGQLPGEQGKLADRTDAVEKDLEAVGGVVFVWANKDIVNSMNEVKDDLGKPATGTPTQTEQQRIVDQLAAMIDSLKTDPKKSPFAQKGGGKGGQSGPRLPTEAELRLLKALQQSINKNTIVLDKLPGRDKPRLLELGERQGKLRNVFGQLLAKVSGGKMTLPPEPANRDMLPEESKGGDVENKELEQNMLGGDPTADGPKRTVDQVANRMARSRQRLAINDDPGKVTQIIQKKIIASLDDLIDAARQQQYESQSAPKGQGGMAKQAKEGNKGQQEGKGGESIAARPGGQGATESTLNGADERNADLTGSIKETLQNWGALTPRQRAAVSEGAGEHVIEKYRNYVEDYYRSLATEATRK